MPRTMIPASKTRRSLSGKLAKASTRYGVSDATVEDLKREYKTETLADYIRALVDQAPALTVEQRERLALLLRGSTSERPEYDVLDSVPSAAEGVTEKPGTHAATRPE
jgi:transposase